MSGTDGHPALDLRGVRVSYRAVPVLQGIDLTVGSGEFVVLMGPNGSGKSTLLRAIVGLEASDAGSIRVFGREVGRLPPHRRGVVLMGQEPGLFVRRSVFDNIAYAAGIQGAPELEVCASVARLADRLGIAHLLDRRPGEISGGERQRVALARALAARPRVLLLDEPFNALDVTIRADLMADFRSVLAAAGVAVLLVTHDRVEGLFLGDRVALLFDGRIESVGPPREVFDRPPSRRAARFLGYNVIREDGTWRAVAPRDVGFAPGSEGGRRGYVVAGGPVGGGGRLIVQLESGERIEIETGPTVPIPASGTWGRVSWPVAIDLPDRSP
ncbi:MAG: ABC transporter ATP-binding protein [Thermoplasmata archaeon]